MTHELLPVPANDFFAKAYTQYQGTPIEPNPIISVEPIDVKIRRALQYDMDLPVIEQIPDAVWTIEQGIYETFQIQGMERFGLGRYLPSQLSEECDKLGLIPIHYNFGRLARDILENRDSHRFTVRDRYWLIYKSQHEKLYPGAVWETISDIKSYMTNNDALLFIPELDQEEFIDALKQNITNSFHTHGDPHMPIDHDIFPFTRPGLSILQTTIQTIHGPWVNYTVLMDPGYDLQNDFRDGPQLSDFENLSLLLAWDTKNGEMVHTITQAWFLNRRMTDYKIHIETPSEYASMWEWFNAVTRMAYQFNRNLHTDDFDHIRSHIGTIFDPQTLSGLRSDFERLYEHKPEYTVAPVQKNFVLRQLITMIELGGDASVILFDTLGALPAMVKAFGGDTSRNRKDLARSIVERAKKFDHERPSTNVQMFVASLQEYAIHQSNGTKREVLPDVDGLFYMMEKLTGEDRSDDVATSQDLILDKGIPVELGV